MARTQALIQERKSPGQLLCFLESLVENIVFHLKKLRPRSRNVKPTAEEHFPTPAGLVLKAGSLSDVGGVEAWAKSLQQKLMIEEEEETAGIVSQPVAAARIVTIVEPVPVRASYFSPPLYVPLPPPPSVVNGQLRPQTPKPKHTPVIEPEYNGPRFTLFKSLPAEIRLQIWSYVLPPRRQIIEVQRIQGQNYTLVNRRKLSVLLWVNRESRTEALRGLVAVKDRGQWTYKDRFNDILFLNAGYDPGWQRTTFRNAAFQFYGTYRVYRLAVLSSCLTRTSNVNWLIDLLLDIARQWKGELGEVYLLWSSTPRNRMLKLDPKGQRMARCVIGRACGAGLGCKDCQVVDYLPRIKELKGVMEARLNAIKWRNNTGPPRILLRKVWLDYGKKEPSTWD